MRKELLKTFYQFFLPVLALISAVELLIYSETVGSGIEPELVSIAIFTIILLVASYFIARRQHKKQLLIKEKERHLKKFIKYTPAAIAMFDKDLRYMMASEQWYRDYGIEGTDIIGRSHYEVFPEINDIHEWKTIHQHCLQGHSMKRDKDAFEREDGSTDYIRWEIQPWYTYKNEVGGLIMFTEVITQRVNAERALKASEERFRGIFANSAVSVALVDLDGRPLIVNQALQEMLGYSEQELRKMTFAEFTHPDDAKKDVSLYEELMKGNIDHYRLEKRYIRKNGDTLWGDLTVSVIRDGNGKILHALGIVQDITEQKEYAAQLKAERNKAKLYFDKAASILLVLDKEGRIMQINEKGCQVLQVKPEEVIGKDWFGHYLPGEDIAARKQSYLKVVKGNKPPREYYENELLNAQGEKRLIAWRNTLLKNEEGEITGMMSSGEDITEKKRAEDALRKINEELEQRVKQRTAELEQANQELESFSYSVSHDLRSPLRAINGFAEILEEDHLSKLDEEGREALDIISANATKMGRLIDDLLAFSRLGRKEMVSYNFDLNEMVQEVIREEMRNIQERDIHFEVEQLPMATGDASMLRQVMLNLVSNAIKYSAKKPKAIIKIGTFAENGTTVVYVKDNGAGFDMAYKDKLFGVFQRLHSNEEFEGTGVGLALAQRIIQRHGGKLWAEAEEGRGATFYFTLGSSL